MKPLLQSENPASDELPKELLRQFFCDVNVLPALYLHRPANESRNALAWPIAGHWKCYFDDYLAPSLQMGFCV